MISGSLPGAEARPVTAGVGWRGEVGDQKWGGGGWAALMCILVRLDSCLHPSLDTDIVCLAALCEV